MTAKKYAGLGLAILACMPLTALGQYKTESKLDVSDAAIAPIKESKKKGSDGQPGNDKSEAPKVNPRVQKLSQLVHDRRPSAILKEWSVNVAQIKEKQAKLPAVGATALGLIGSPYGPMAASVVFAAEKIKLTDP